MAKVLRLCQPTVAEPVAEAALRGMVSLCYRDRISVPLVADHPDFVYTLVTQTGSPSPAIQMYAIMALTNLAVHDFNKIKIVEAGGKSQDQARCAQTPIQSRCNP